MDQISLGQIFFFAKVPHQILALLLKKNEFPLSRFQSLLLSLPMKRSEDIENWSLLIKGPVSLL